MKRTLLALGLLALLGGAALWWFALRSTVPPPDFADIAYAQTSSCQRIDIWGAPSAAGPMPVILWVHGGGFAMGDKSNPEGHAALQAAGFAVASMNYRYSSDAIWPAQRDDVAAAIRHLRSYASRYGIDPDRIGIWGASAGGHLAATAGTALASDPETRVQAVVDWFGPIDFVAMDADMAASGVSTSTTLASDSPESRLIGAAVGERPDLARAASPLNAIMTLPAGATLPPFLIMHGAQDDFIAARQSERLAAALRARGGTAELVILPDGTHGGGGFTDAAATQRVVAFFARHLRPDGRGDSQAEGTER